MAAFIDYYKILQIDCSADFKIIKAAFKQLSFSYHPDINKDPSAEEKYKIITEAYFVLRDLEKRKSYDEIYFKNNVDYKYCSNCGDKVSPDSEYCKHCGNKLSLNCLNCGELMSIFDKNCKYCGAAIGQTNEMDDIGDPNLKKMWLSGGFKTMYSMKHNWQIAYQVFTARNGKKKLQVCFNVERHYLNSPHVFIDFGHDDFNPRLEAEIALGNYRIELDKKYKEYKKRYNL